MFDMTLGSAVPYALWNFNNTFSAALNSSIDFALA
jgi:hypothetical protein